PGLPLVRPDRARQRRDLALLLRAAAEADVPGGRRDPRAARARRRGRGRARLRPRAARRRAVLLLVAADGVEPHGRPGARGQAVSARPPIDSIAVVLDRRADPLRRALDDLLTRSFYS